MIPLFASPWERIFYEEIANRMADDGGRQTFRHPPSAILFSFTRTLLIPVGKYCRVWIKDIHYADFARD